MTAQRTCFGIKGIRNKDKKEVDFLMTKDQEPLLLVETKLTETTPAPSLLEFQSILKVPAIQLVHTPGTIRRVIDGAHGKVAVFSASRWLASLP